MQMKILLKDPLFREYYLKVPRFPHHIEHPTPWTLWVSRQNKWASKNFAVWKDAFLFARPHIKEWDDFSIVSRIILFTPPPNVRNAYRHLQWCYRCRRPTTFKAYARHHALRNDIHRYFSEWPVCLYCGCREDAEHRMYPG